MSAIFKSNIENHLGIAVEEKHMELLSGLLIEKHFDKKAVFLDRGNSNRYIYFIAQGSCYSYLAQESGEKQVIQFAIEGMWISDLSSFFSGGKAVFTLEALERLSTFALSKENFQKACDSIPWFDRYFRIIIQNAYIATQYRLAQTNSKEIETRYKEFSALYPHFIQRLPQYLIASYLGVKPQSLSRIRKESLLKDLKTK